MDNLMIIRSKSARLIGCMNNVKLFITCASLLLISCDNAGDLARNITAKNELVVLTTNQPTTYYIDREGNPAGPEYEMTSSFAEHMGVSVRYIKYDSIESVITGLEKGEGDIIAAGLTITTDRQQSYDFGPEIMNVDEYLVCHRDITRSVSNIDDLEKLNIVIPASSSYIQTLKEQYPTINWNIKDGAVTEKLLEKVRSKEINCTISDSTIFDINRRYYPEITNKYTLITGSKLAWMYKNGNSDFTGEIENWLKTYNTSGEYARLKDKYYGYIDAFDYVDIQTFKRRIKKRLPKYKNLFIDAATKNNITPSLLAAQSYQESHWDPKAKSPTGVRGIMMLTKPVAKSLGVSNRLDAKSNIYAGAKFQAKMINMLDENVIEPDRTWLGLAAYNVGRGHFRDAQKLARSLGKNPDLWVDMKDVLPLLSEKKYYKDLKYGYARGNEPVQYVNRIRDYKDILSKYF